MRGREDQLAALLRILEQLNARLGHPARSSVHATGTVRAHEFRPDHARHRVSHFQAATIHVVIALVRGAAEYGLSVAMADQTERNQQAAKERA